CPRACHSRRRATARFDRRVPGHRSFSRPNRLARLNFRLGDERGRLICTIGAVGPGVRRSTVPTYQYRCEECESTFERTETISDHEVSKPQCPKCGSKKVSVASPSVNTSAA